MTEREKRKETACSRKGALIAIFLLFALVMALRYSSLCAEGVSYGMELAVNRLIPSLFPFMVIADMIIKSRASDFVAKIFCKPLSTLLGISQSGASCFLLGMLLGFPIGIKSALSLYEAGKIDKSELMRLSLFCSAPSPAFFICAVGEGFFGSLLFGVALYLIAIAVNIVIGVFSRALFSRHRGELCYESLALPIGEKEKGGAALFLDAVSSSALSLLSISAFVVFFSMLGKVIEYFLSLAGISRSASALIIGALEMTGGAARASLDGEAGAPLVAAIVGFSGLSVLCQIAFICRDSKLSLFPYFLARLFSAAAYFLLSLGAIRLFGDRMNFSQPSAPSFILYGENSLSIAVFALFVCSCFIALDRGKRKIFAKGLYKS